MQSELKPIDRWRENHPVEGDQPERSEPVKIAILIAIGVLAFLVLGGALTHAKTTATRPVMQDTRPHVVIFTSASCIHCQNLHAISGHAFRGCIVHEVQQGTDRFNTYLDEMFRQVPLDPQNRPLSGGYVGPLPARPRGFQIPAIWFPDGSGYWVSFESRATPRLYAWISEQKAESTAKLTAIPSTRQPRSITTSPMIGLAGPVCDFCDEGRCRCHDIDPPGPGELQSWRNASASLEILDGVAVIVCVAELSDSHAAERAALAERIDQALQELIDKHVGQQVDAYFVARVADPETYDRMAALTGIDPGSPGHEGPPGVVHLLIPERFHGLKGMIAGRVEVSLANHFFAKLRNVEINPILQRLDGGTYEAAIAAVSARVGPFRSPGNPFNGLAYLASAWMSERSDLARRILQRIGWADA